MRKILMAPFSTNPADFTIATIGSHTALQILKGARDEGLKNIVICKEGSERPYKSYGVADEIITIPDWKDWDDALEATLRERNAIIIPHGSFIAYMGHERVMDMNLMYYGTKEILQWESDRSMERKWLLQADIKLLSQPEAGDRSTESLLQQRGIHASR